MDIENNGRLNPFYFKHFSLGAIAFAFLIFHAQPASAINCTAIISGTTLADEICEFNSLTGTSVTVINEGQVGGIDMNSYSPSSGQIVINAGGLVSNSTSPGIRIFDSVLSNGIINNGTINTVADSLDITDNSIVGNIINTGSISSSEGNGFHIFNSSTVNGNITNSGSIRGGANNTGLVIGFDSQVNGNISNTGIINSGDAGGSAILVYFTSAVDGSILNSGTINATDSGIAVYTTSNISGDITNNGSIIASSNGIYVAIDSHVGGSISNTGSINADEVGILINSFSSVDAIDNSGVINGDDIGISIIDSSVVDGVISNSGTIQGGSEAIFVEAGSTLSEINLIGQAARIIGSVDASATDFNITNDAIFTSEGSFNVNNFNIDSDAMFTMANTITALDALTNAGTLVLNTTQTLNANNGYIQSTGAVFQVGVTNTSDYGQLIVDNQVDLSQSGNINVEIAEDTTLQTGAILSNIISGNTLLDPIDGFNVTDNSFIWQFVANNTGVGGVNLTATIDPTAYNACRGNYCQAAANVIIGQVAAANPSFSPYAALTTQSAFQTAASQATPELTNDNIQVIQLTTNAVMNIVPMWNSLKGKSAGDEMLYQTGKVWLKSYGASMTQNENSNVNGFNANAYGFVIGRDIQLNEDWLLGAAVAAGKDNLDGQSTLSGQYINSNTYQGILYGARKFSHDIYLATQALLGYQNNDSTRPLPLYNSTAQASYNNWFTNLRTQLGWSIYKLHQDLIFTPELDASYLFINQASYQESGSLMNLSVASSNNASLVVGAYLNAAYHLVTLHNQQNVTLTGYAGAAGDLLNSQPQTTATFVAGGPSFTTYGTQFNQLMFRGGVGLSMANSIKPLKMSLNYDLQAGNDAYSGTGSVTLSYEL